MVAAARRCSRPPAGKCPRRTAASSPPVAAAGNREPRYHRRLLRDTGAQIHDILSFKPIRLNGLVVLYYILARMYSVQSIMYLLRAPFFARQQKLAPPCMIDVNEIL